METIDTAGPRISDPDRELDATAHPLPQHNQLMSECPPQYRFQSGVGLATRLPLLFAGDNGRYCGLAIVTEFCEGIPDASYFLDAPTYGTALPLDVRATCFSSRRDLGQPRLAHVGKVCEMLLDASGNTAVTGLDVSAGFFYIRLAGTEARLRQRARHEQE